jgi:hypothetical protein
MISPSRTRVSIPFLVFSIRSAEGCQLLGSPKTTIAEPPNLKTDFSLPLENGVSKGCTCWIRPQTSHRLPRTRAGRSDASSRYSRAGGCEKGCPLDVNAGPDRRGLWRLKESDAIENPARSSTPPRSSSRSSAAPVRGCRILLRPVQAAATAHPRTFLTR